MNSLGNGDEFSGIDHGATRALVGRLYPLILEWELAELKLEELRSECLRKDNIRQWMGIQQQAERRIRDLLAERVDPVTCSLKMDR